ncbi:HAD-IIB family hydrolase [Thermaerobacter subterraneus]|uniref:HAD-superfamily hydrolase, subfamily IIB n=1 Tax=Thermaerobacter subterraneus DSM 13965 TaxID=867903 RepID=K6PZK1_9FIRM|nr:HAD-IIB family hydrolase [Thermaerobacter subterraneus]EKP94238.1 HAD-superfamily hydrolase, subfamily IIB [Thermaerobacter subterraneus DSM 13965]
MTSPPGGPGRRYRLLALDLDGTVLDPRGLITPRVRRAVARARAAGIRVVLATGRVLPSAWVYARQLGLEGPLVVSDGAVLATLGDPGDGGTAGSTSGTVPAETGTAAAEAGAAAAGAGLPRRGPWTVLDVQPFPRDLAEAVTAELVAAGCPVVVQFPQFLASSRRPPVGTLIRSLAVPYLRHYWVLRRYVVVHPGAELARFVARATEPPVKISVLGQRAVLRPLEERILQRYGQVLRLTHSGPGSFDLLPPGTHKAAGLQRLAARLGIDREQVVAVGDNDNDCEMLRWAGLGVAMGNADPAVRECAGRVTASNAEDGVARLIEEVLLGGDLGA